MIVDKRRKEKKDPSREFITQICELYGDVYDDREEDSFQILCMTLWRIR